MISQLVAKGCRGRGQIGAQERGHAGNDRGGTRMDKMDSRLRGESTPQKHPSHGSKVLGGLEEHLASWTKGCEGQKGSGNTPLGLNKSPRGEGRRERISSLVVPTKAGTHASWQDWIPARRSATGQLAGPCP